MWEIFNELLLRKGIRTMDVARATGIDPSTFSDWKRGKSKPKVDKMAKIAEYLGVSVAYLNGEPGETLPPTFFMSPMQRQLSRYSAELSEITFLYGSLDSSDREKAADFMKFLLTSDKYKKVESSEIG